MEQTIEAAQNLYLYSAEGSEERQFASRLLLQVAQRADLPVERFIEAAQNLNQFVITSERADGWRFTIQLLLIAAQNQQLIIDQRLQAGAQIFASAYALYTEKLQALQIVIELLSGETSAQFFEAHWESVFMWQLIEPDLLDIPLLAKFSCEERLPAKVRNVLYYIRHYVGWFPDLES